MDSPSINNNSTSSICDYTSKTKIMLVNHPGNNQAMVSLNDTNSNWYRLSPKMTIQYLPDTKIICGYKCSKAIYTIAGDTNKYYVCFTNEITYSNQSLISQRFPELKGFPLEYNFYNEDGEVVVSANEISTTNVEDSIFEIPKGYKINH